jgi:hypothetical protein
MTKYLRSKIRKLLFGSGMPPAVPALVDRSLRPAPTGHPTYDQRYTTCDHIRMGAKGRKNCVLGLDPLEDVHAGVYVLHIPRNICGRSVALPAPETQQEDDGRCERSALGHFVSAMCDKDCALGRRTVCSTSGSRRRRWCASSTRLHSRDSLVQIANAERASSESRSGYPINGL